MNDKQKRAADIKALDEIIATCDRHMLASINYKIAETAAIKSDSTDVKEMLIRLEEARTDLLDAADDFKALLIGMSGM